MTMPLRARSGERGAALLETALMMPLLLFVAVSIFEFGRAYQTWQVLTNAVREGARVAVLPSTAPGDSEARVRDYMQKGQLSKWDTASVSVTAGTINYGTGTATSSVVTVSYPFDFMVLNPVAKLLNPNSTTGAPITITASAQMRNEAQGAP
jgi:Flp pilus assembly protein TadG